jgi:uncharacterized protein YhjY with autotransporter beta-barrel domain
MSRTTIAAIFLSAIASGSAQAQTVPVSCLLFGTNCPSGAPFVPHPPGTPGAGTTLDAPVPYIAAGNLTADAAVGVGGIGFNSGLAADLLLNEYLAGVPSGNALALRGQRGGGAAADQRGTEKLFGIVQGDYNSADKRLSGSSREYDYDVSRGSAGAGYRFSPDTVGIALVHASRSRATAISGSTTVDSAGVVLSGVQRFGRDTAVELHVKYSDARLDITRNLLYANGSVTTFTGSPHGRQTESALSLRHRFSWGALVLVPSVRVEHLRLHVDGYQESSATSVGAEVSNQEVESLRSVVGASVAYAFSTPVGVISPRLTAEWIHEYRNRARTIQVGVQGGACCVNLAFLTDKPDTNYGFVRAGVAMSINRTTDVFLDVMTTIEKQDIRNGAVYALGLQSRF